MTQKIQGIEKMPPLQLSRAVAIADEAMMAQLQCHAVAVRGCEKTRFGLCDRFGMEVAALSEADPAIVEAFDWLKGRGLVVLRSDEHGEVIEIAVEAKAAESSTDIVPVWYWDAKRYNPDGVEPLTDFNIEIEDRRKSSGQLHATIAPVEGCLEDMLPVTMEINRLPGSGDDVPCLHLHFDDSNMAASFFKQGDRYIIRPETGVALRGTVLPNGESALILE